MATYSLSSKVERSINGLNLLWRIVNRYSGRNSRGFITCTTSPWASRCIMSIWFMEVSSDLHGIMSALGTDEMAWHGFHLMA
jgi:hypothetical protein